MITKTYLQTQIHNLTVRRDSNMATIESLANQRQALIDETNAVHGSLVAYTNLLVELEASQAESKDNQASAIKDIDKARDRLARKSLPTGSSNPNRVSVANHIASMSNAERKKNSSKPNSDKKKKR